MRQNYEKLYAELHKHPDKKTSEYIIQILPWIYAWGIIKIFHSAFSKSIIEYDKRFMIKCAQISFYELLGICVTDSYVSDGLKETFRDPILNEFYPELNFTKENQKIQRKLSIKTSKSQPHIEEIQPPKQIIEFDCPAANKAWNEYIEDTRHSDKFFVDLRDNARAFIAETSKKYSLFQSKLGSMEAYTSNKNITQGVNLPSENHIKSPRIIDKSILDILMSGDRSYEEVIVYDLDKKNLLNTAQVSPVMERVVGKIAYGLSAARIPYKKPLKFNPKKAELLKNAKLSHEIKEVGRTDIIRAEFNKQRNPENANFEKWLKSGMVTSNTKTVNKLIDNWYREEGYKIGKDLIIDMPDSLKDQRKVNKKLKNVLNPQEKLEEKCEFNDVFGEKLDKDLSTVEQNYMKRCNELQQILKTTKGKNKTGLSSLNNTNKNLQIQSCDDIIDFKENDIVLPQISYSTRVSTKIRLTNTIKRLSDKYTDKKEIEEKMLNSKKELKLDNIVKKIKKVNQEAKLRLNKFDKNYY